MLDTNELLLICEQIALTGSTPSVALLRAKSPQKLPLPQAIKVIKSYQSGARPNSVSRPTVEVVEETLQLSVEQRLQALELHNKHLNERLVALEAKLKGNSATKT